MFHYKRAEGPENDKSEYETVDTLILETKPVLLTPKNRFIYYLNIFILLILFWMET